MCDDFLWSFVIISHLMNVRLGAKQDWSTRFSPSDFLRNGPWEVEAFIVASSSPFFQVRRWDKTEYDNERYR